MQGSRLLVSTVGLASAEPWEIQYGHKHWDARWGDLPGNWNGAWGTFWPAGDQLIVYVFPITTAATRSPARSRLDSPLVP